MFRNCVHDFYIFKNFFVKICDSYQLKVMCATCVKVTLKADPFLCPLCGDDTGHGGRMLHCLTQQHQHWGLGAALPQVSTTTLSLL